MENNLKIDSLIKFFIKETYNEISSESLKHMTGKIYNTD